MKKIITIWKESIYKNNFTCSCGNQLADPETGEIKGYVLTDEDGRCWCNECNQPCCVAREAETELENGMYGDINQYLGGARN